MFLYSTDRAYLPITCISVASLAQCYRAGATPHIALLTHGVSAEDRARAAAFIEGLGASLTLREIDGAAFEPWASRRRQSAAKFAPLKFDTYLDDVPERIAYIDSDTVVMDDAAKLLEMPLDGCVLGAVDDLAVIANERVAALNEKLGLPDGSGYFNSGVMAIDTRRWIEAGIGSQALAVFTQRPHLLTWNDQCALNAVLGGRWKRMPFRWNALNGAMPRHWPVSIGHYAGWYKPWALGMWKRSRLMGELVGRDHIARYWDLIDMSPWRADFGPRYRLQQSCLTTYRVVYSQMTGKLRQVRARLDETALLDVAARHPELLA